MINCPRISQHYISNHFSNPQSLQIGPNNELALKCWCSRYNLNQFTGNRCLTSFIMNQKARTRLGGCHTRVRRGPTQDVTSNLVAHVSVPRLRVFFFLLGFTLTQLDSCRRGSIRVESASIRVEPGWFDQNWTVSAISGRIGRRPKRPIRLKHAGNGRN